MVIVEATARLLPGVLGNPDSLKEESHTLTNKDGSLNFDCFILFLGLYIPENIEPLDFCFLDLLYFLGL